MSHIRIDFYIDPCAQCKIALHIIQGKHVRVVGAYTIQAELSTGFVKKVRFRNLKA